MRTFYWTDYTKGLAVFIFYQRPIHTAAIAHAITYSNVSPLISTLTCRTLTMLSNIK